MAQTNENNGQDYTGIDITTNTYNTIASFLTDNPNIKEGKVLIKHIGMGQTTAVSLLVNITKEDDKIKAVATTLGGVSVGWAVGTGTSALLTAIATLVVGSAAVVTAPIAIGISVVAVGAAGYVSYKQSDNIAEAYDNWGKMYDSWKGEINGVELEKTPQSTKITTPQKAKDFINDPKNKPLLKNENVEIIDDTNQSYEIKAGDTLWDIANKIKPRNYTTQEIVHDIIQENPWLVSQNRISDDGKYILIKPEENLAIPSYEEVPITLEISRTDTTITYEDTIYTYKNGNLDKEKVIQRIVDIDDEGEGDDSSDGDSYNSSGSIRRTDPLALDLNHDRKINTTSLQNSNTYFDMDNSGTSEKTGWIDKGDGLLVFDENNDGKIDNINELFGNNEVEGYTELKQKFDSNNDNVIDNKDERFNELKVWIDANGDGVSQDGELKTLSELNITAINIDNKDTSIDSNGNEIFKTSTFTQNGNEYLSGDLNFLVNNRDTNMNRFKNEDGNFESSFDSFILPTLKGSGEVIDTTFAYDENDTLKSLALEMINDDIKAYNNFENFIKEWAGLNALYLNHNIQRDTLNIDDKVWLLETLNGYNFFKPSIEVAYNNDTNTTNDYNTSYINEHYQTTINKNFVAFALQSFYKDEFDGAYYSINDDKVIIEDESKFLNSISNFYNQEDLNIQDLSLFTSILNTVEDYNLDDRIYILSVNNFSFQNNKLKVS